MKDTTHLNVCPSEAALLAFQRGELPEASLSAIAEHLDRCPRCESVAQRLDAQLDPALALLRTQDGPSTGPHRSQESTPPGSQAPVALPPRLGPYEVMEELGRGGMGASSGRATNTTTSSSPSRCSRPTACATRRPSLASAAR